MNTTIKKEIESLNNSKSFDVQNYVTKGANPPIHNKGWSDHDSSFTGKLQQVADEFNKFIQTKDKPSSLEDFIRKHTDLVGDPLDDMIERAKNGKPRQCGDKATPAQNPTDKAVSPFKGFSEDDKGEWIDISTLPSFLGKTPTERLEAFKKLKIKGCQIVDPNVAKPLGFQVGPTEAEEKQHKEDTKKLVEFNKQYAEQVPQNAARGLRYNTGKTLYNLIPPYPLEQVAKVFTKGAQKYAPNNWKKGMPWSEVEGSLMRHFEAYRMGEDFDEESGLYHMAHVAVNALFLIDYYRSNPQFDDRIKSYMKKPKIVLDIDEVLCGWAAGYKAWTSKDIQAKYWDSRYGFTSELAELAKNKEFWLSLPCIRRPDFVPHAYVSSRSIPVEWTQEWLEKNGLPCRPVHHVPFDHSKIEVLKSLGVDYFVDDRFENFFEAETAGICSFLMDASHNQHYHVGFKRIHDLKIKNIVR